MTDIELSPCPCCGSPATMHAGRDTSGPYVTWVECNSTDCGLTMESCHDEHLDKVIFECAKRWNQRHSNIAIVDFVNRVCEMAEHKMLMTHKLEGSHYAAMMELAAEYGSVRNGRVVTAG